MHILDEAELICMSCLDGVLSCKDPAVVDYWATGGRVRKGQSPVLRQFDWTGNQTPVREVVDPTSTSTGLPDEKIKSATSPTVSISGGTDHGDRSRSEGTSTPGFAPWSSVSQVSLQSVRQKLTSLGITLPMEKDDDFIWNSFITSVEALTKVDKEGRLVSLPLMRDLLAVYERENPDLARSEHAPRSQVHRV